MGGCFSRGYCTKDAVSNGRIGGLSSGIRDSVTSFVNAAESELGVQLRVSQGHRTDAEEDALYAQGRSTAGLIVTNARGGQSNHNFGLAIDVVAMNRDGSVNWGFDMSSVAPIAQRFGLSWGGNWARFPDYPHFENTYGLSPSQMQSLRPRGTLYPIIPNAAHWKN